MSPRTSSPRSVAVIGAGAGGLAAARRLLADGHEVVVHELGSRIGGLWVYDNDNGLSAAYRSLHINSEPRTTAFPGFPFPTGSTLFPSHDNVCTYLEAFADRYGIREHIRFRSAVTAVEPAPDGRWSVVLADGTRETHNDVVVATGHQGTPAHPGVAREFTGEYLHSHDYREPEPFRGRSVLVVGVGNSGLDIAADLATVAGRTVVSARSPVLVMPRMIFGVPSARVLATVARPWLPWRVQRTVMRLISRGFHGRMEQWGLRTPETRTHPASNATFMAHVAYQKITCRPGIASVDGRRVTYTDGSSDEVDVVIAATGYEIHLPFLADDVSPVRGRRVELFHRVVSPRWPGLYFVGFFNVSGGANISMMDVQAEWLAALVSGRAGLPDEAEMRRTIAAEGRRLAERYPGAERYGLELEPRTYRKAVAAELARAPGAARTTRRVSSTTGTSA